MASWASRLTGRQFDAAIIDLDGTLVDTLDDFVAALNRMLAELKLPGSPQVSRGVVERMVGKGSEHLVSSVLKHLVAQYPQGQSAIDTGADAGDAALAQALESFQKHYAAANGQKAQVYPGVLQGLRSLQQSGLKLACLTNKPLAFAEALLEMKSLRGFFACVYGGDSFDRKKPDPLPVIKTCEVLGTSPSRTLMIGDSSNDAQAARAAGCPVVLVKYGYNHGQAISTVDADGFIDSLAELSSKNDPETPA